MLPKTKSTFVLLYAETYQNQGRIWTKSRVQFCATFVLLKNWQIFVSIMVENRKIVSRGVQCLTSQYLVKKTWSFFNKIYCIKSRYFVCDAKNLLWLVLLMWAIGAWASWSKMNTCNLYANQRNKTLIYL